MEHDRKTDRAPPDDYARGSFTFRRMKRSQIIGLLIALAVMVVGFIALEYA